MIYVAIALWLFFIYICYRAVTRPLSEEEKRASGDAPVVPFNDETNFD